MRRHLSTRLRSLLTSQCYRCHPSRWVGDAAPSGGAAAAAVAGETDTPQYEDPVDVALAMDTDSDDLAATVANEYELHPKGGAEEESSTSEASEDVIQSIDMLLDDFLLCKTDVLHNFARSRGLKKKPKRQLIIDLLDAAEAEAKAPKEFLATKKLLGDLYENQPVSSGPRRSWTNETLEAVLLEAACEKTLRGRGRSNAWQSRIRSNAKGNLWILQRLHRAFQDEYEAVAMAAVGGVFRQCKEDAAAILNENNPLNVLSCFCAYLSTLMQEAYAPSMVSHISAGDTLASLEIVCPSIEQSDVSSLSKLVELLDYIAADMEQRDREWETAPVTLHGHDTANTFIGSIERYVARHREGQLEGVPKSVINLAAQFCNWEMIVRNDIPSLMKAPSLFFDVLLANVAALKHTKEIFGPEVTGAKEIPGIYRRAVRAVLENWIGEQETDDIVIKLGVYSHAAKGDRSLFVTPDLIEAILSQIQSPTGSEQTLPSNERVALVLREAALTASRSNGSAGTYPLLVNLAEQLRFHLRFSRIFNFLTPAERASIKDSPRIIDMHAVLKKFEKEFRIDPVDRQGCIFLCIVLLYLCMRPFGQMSAVLDRFTSCTANEELGVLRLADGRSFNASSVRVARPPQLSMNSWMAPHERTRSVYSFLPTGAVKGAANDIMLASQAPMIHALDAISRVPWRVSKYMLFVQEAVVQEGYGFGKIRPAFFPLRFVSMKSGDIPNHSVEGVSLFNNSLRLAYKKQANLDWRRLTELRSTRIHHLLALRQARALMNQEVIYFPHNMDFRGRMYPLPGRLNHTGSDPFRALLENAQPKELGTEGVFWLKVHLANQMGQSKLNFEERVQYVDQHIEDVIQSAEAPLSGDRWWQDGSHPFQALQACKELADAMKYSQGPERFPSRIPVAVDGSYNGLQHYSAIGRDEQGGKLVNLIPSERPADAYTGILGVMMKSIEADAARDHEIAQRCIGTGIGLDKAHIKRKTIKRPIMTQVYGVTNFGMKEQIMDELLRQNESHGLWTPLDVREMAMYLREKLTESLGVTFKETQECRMWLAKVARIIWECQPPDLRSAFTWTTPLGLVVRQPYRRGRETNVFTFQGFSKVSGSTIEPADRKQLTALAPNVIHSLDATHLAMTAMEMEQRGLSMMAVHDSYWSHACDLGTLSKVLREQFVALYDNFDPLLEFKEQWEEVFYFDLRRHGVKLPDPPPRGKLNLREVLNSQFFFS